MLVISKLFLARCELVKSNNPHPFDPSAFELGPNDVSARFGGRRRIEFIDGPCYERGYRAESAGWPSVPSPNKLTKSGEDETDRRYALETVYQTW